MLHPSNLNSTQSTSRFPVTSPNLNTYSVLPNEVPSLGIETTTPALRNYIAEETDTSQSTDGSSPASSQDYPSIYKAADKLWYCPNCSKGHKRRNRATHCLNRHLQLNLYDCNGDCGQFDWWGKLIFSLPALLIKPTVNLLVRQRKLSDITYMGGRRLIANSGGYSYISFPR